MSKNYIYILGVLALTGCSPQPIIDVEEVRQKQERSVSVHKEYQANKVQLINNLSSMDANVKRARELDPSPIRPLDCKNKKISDNCTASNYLDSLLK